MTPWTLEEAIDYYRREGAPEDQSMIVALLREAQAEQGALTQETLNDIARCFGLSRGFLPALIRRIPDLRMHTHPNRLEVCRNCGRQLAVWIEREYGASPGGASSRGGFTFHVVGCMKNCKSGPSARWNGELISHATEEKLREKIGE